MANISSNLVVLRNKKKREKRSIYSRYFKEFSFKSSPSPGCGSLPCELVSVSSNRNINISNKTADTAAVRARAGGMPLTKSYADQVRELLRKDQINVDTLDRSKHSARPPLPPLPPTPGRGRKEADQTSRSHELGQLAPEEKYTRKVYIRNTSGVESAPFIKSKLSTFSSTVISR